MSSSASDLPSKGDVQVDDNSSSFSYFPAEAWTTSSQQPWIHSAGTFHLTRSKSAQMSFAFNGTRVWLYGDKNVDHRYFRAAVDDGAESVLSTYGDTWTAQQLLYTSPPLRPGAHVLFATNLAAHSAFGVDYILYRPVAQGSIDNITGISAPSDPTETLSTTAPAQPVHQRSRTGESHWQLIVSIVVSFLGALYAVSTLLFLWNRRRRRIRRERLLHPLPPPLLPVESSNDTRLAKVSLLKNLVAVIPSK